tara:strand:- start:98 stop:943 length:846 start_codon:yes stop_codon:yes gene_type:complete
LFLNIGKETIYAYTGGKKVDSKKPAIVFIHGAANDHSVWALQSRYFAFHGWNAIAIDLPGHGKSDGPHLTSINKLSSWINDIITTVNLSEVVLVGHSMGSLIALDFAGNFQRKTAGLVLIGTASPMPVSDSLLKTSSEKPQEAYNMVNNFSFSARGHLGPNAAPGSWMAGNGMRLMEKANDLTLYKDFLSCDRYQEGLNCAKKVLCPSLIISGSKDKMTPAKFSKEIAIVLANTGKFRNVNLETGHAIMAEKPDLVLDILIEFTDKIKEEKGTASNKEKNL